MTSLMRRRLPRSSPLAHDNRIVSGPDMDAAWQHSGAWLAMGRPAARVGTLAERCGDITLDHQPGWKWYPGRERPVLARMAQLVGFGGRAHQQSRRASDFGKQAGEGRAPVATAYDGDPVAHGFSLLVAHNYSRCLKKGDDHNAEHVVVVKEVYRSSAVVALLSAEYANVSCDELPRARARVPARHHGQRGAVRSAGLQAAQGIPGTSYFLPLGMASRHRSTLFYVNQRQKDLWQC